MADWPLEPLEPTLGSVELAELPLQPFDDDVLDDLLPDLLEARSGTLLTPNAASPCWGSLLSSMSTSCTPGFVVGRGHFKNKFCPTCRSAGFLVPAERVRALLGSQHDLFQNGMGSGLWTEDKESGMHFRLVNQTLKCSGPRIIILHRSSTPPPAGMLWAELPSKWVGPGGMVRLVVSKGTLSPTHALDSMEGEGPLFTMLGAGGIVSPGAGSSSFHTQQNVPLPMPMPMANKRSRAGSEASEPPSLSSTTASQVLELHERLASLVVSSFGLEEAEQEAEGFDDEQRAAFVTLLVPLQMSASLLRQKASGEGGDTRTASSSHRADEPEGTDGAQPLVMGLESGSGLTPTTAGGDVPAAGGDVVMLSEARMVQLNAKLFGALAGVGASHELRLAYRGLSDDDLQLISRTLGGGVLGGLRKLDLASNYLTSSCAPTLAEILATAPVLEVLDVGGIAWGDRGFKTLVGGLQRTGITQLRRLMLRQAAVGAEGASALAQLLGDTGAPALEEISLGCNHVGNAGLSAIVGALTLPTTRGMCLRTLTLGNSHGGNAIGDAGAVVLAHAIGASALVHLVHLGLSYNLISDEPGGAALAEALGAQGALAPGTPSLVVSLQQLGISGNRLSEDLIQRLGEHARTHSFCLLARPQQPVSLYAF